jgi:acyl-coenzyme A thioesterase 9
MLTTDSSRHNFHPSPLALRAHQNPWLTPTSPNLASDSASTAHHTHRVELSPEEQAELERPKHMSESYTDFDLPLASDPELYDRYVNSSGGFRESFSNFSAFFGLEVN